MTLKNKYQELISVANEALIKSYSPYSKLKVGSAILSKNGNVYSGCNVENASFSITSCAERNAISSAILAEGPKMEIQAISVVARNSNNNVIQITPCGACRQAIIEFGKTADIVFSANNGEINVKKIYDILPCSYTFDSTNKN